MIKLSKEKKRKAYKSMIKIFTSSIADYSRGFCSVGEEAANLHGIQFGFRETMKYLPELIQYKPHVMAMYGYWFSPYDREVRINIIKEILKTL